MFAISTSISVCSLALLLCVQAQECPPNEIYRQCGTACEPSCAEPDPQVCTEQCVQGCQCEQGFLRNEDGRCVQPYACSAEPSCPENESYHECGTACEPSCDNPDPQFCTMNCVQGCQCDPGFYRNVFGQCVVQRECLDQGMICPPNEEFKECGTMCEPKCGEDLANPRPCIESCQLNVCRCKAGYARDSNGRCVLYRECPAEPSCPENESYRECGTACEPSCDNPDPQICTANCVRGCQCDPGFYRNRFGQCVVQKECLDQGLICPPNEEFKECGTMCEPKCGEDLANPRPCIKSCQLNVCQCKAGYARDSNGRCVLYRECPKEVKCGPNSTFRLCSGCEGTCANPNPICTLQCRAPKCQCNTGYVRHGGRCLPEQACNGLSKSAGGAAS